jgi:hypothetical protein
VLEPISTLTQLIRHPCSHYSIHRSRKNALPETWAIGLVLLHVVTDHQEWTIPTIAEVILLAAILPEAIRVNAHQEGDDMMITAGIMEGGALRYHEDDWMMDMDMDRRLLGEHPTTMIPMIDEHHRRQVDILTHTEVEIHMQDQEVHHQDMEVAMADMTMADIRDDIGKFSTFLLLADYSGSGYVTSKHQLISSLLERTDLRLQLSATTLLDSNSG